MFQLYFISLIQRYQHQCSPSSSLPNYPPKHQNHLINLLIRYCCCDKALIHNNCNIVTCGWVIGLPWTYCYFNMVVWSCAQKNTKKGGGVDEGKILPILWFWDKSHYAFTKLGIPDMITDIKLCLRTLGAVVTWCLHYRCNEQSSGVPTTWIWR